MNSEFKYLIKPGLLLFVLVVMLVAVVNIGMGQITSLSSKITELKESQRLLGIKLSILETVDDVLSEDITFIDVALPSKGPVLYGLSQVKKLAANGNVLVSNLRASATAFDENGISKNSINFEAQGTEADIYRFLASFYTALPLMNLDRLKIDKADGLVRAVVTVNIYSADLPEKIPALSEGVDGFTSSEVEALKKLSDFTLPDFFDPKPTEVSGRENPFN